MGQVGSCEIPLPMRWNGVDPEAGRFSRAESKLPSTSFLYGCIPPLHCHLSPNLSVLLQGLGTHSFLEHLSTDLSSARGLPPRNGRSSDSLQSVSSNVLSHHTPTVWLRVDAQESIYSLILTFYCIPLLICVCARTHAHAMLCAEADVRE